MDAMAMDHVELMTDAPATPELTVNQHGPTLIALAELAQNPLLGLVTYKVLTMRTQ